MPKASRLRRAIAAPRHRADDGHGLEGEQEAREVIPRLGMPRALDTPACPEEERPDGVDQPPGVREEGRVEEDVGDDERRRRPPRCPPPRVPPELAKVRPATRPEAGQDGRDSEDHHGRHPGLLDRGEEAQAESHQHEPLLSPVFQPGRSRRHQRQSQGGQEGLVNQIPAVVHERGGEREEPRRRGDPRHPQPAPQRQQQRHHGYRGEGRRQPQDEVALPQKTDERQDQEEEERPVEVGGVVEDPEPLQGTGGDPGVHTLVMMERPEVEKGEPERQGGGERRPERQPAESAFPAHPSTSGNPLALMLRLYITTTPEDGS